MNTTAGSFSLLKSIVPEDAGVVKRLRAAGAIILGMIPALHQIYYLTTTL
jgi:Asp-tRNA(Asn)/Glu-tRNA(Gln) amidotransferase A subunit family amidase